MRLQPLALQSGKTGTLSRYLADGLLRVNPPEGAQASEVLPYGMFCPAGADAPPGTSLCAHVATVDRTTSKATIVANYLLSDPCTLREIVNAAGTSADRANNNNVAVTNLTVRILFVPVTHDAAQGWTFDTASGDHGAPSQLMLEFADKLAAGFDLRHPPAVARSYASGAASSSAAYNSNYAAAPAPAASASNSGSSAEGAGRAHLTPAQRKEFADTVRGWASDSDTAPLHEFKPFAISAAKIKPEAMTIDYMAKSMFANRNPDGSDLKPVEGVSDPEAQAIIELLHYNGLLPCWAKNSRTGPRSGDLPPVFTHYLRDCGTRKTREYLLHLYKVAYENNPRDKRGIPTVYCRRWTEPGSVALADVVAAIKKWLVPFLLKRYPDGPDARRMTPSAAPSSSSGADMEEDEEEEEDEDEEVSVSDEERKEFQAFYKGTGVFKGECACMHACAHACFRL